MDAELASLVSDIVIGVSAVTVAVLGVFGLRTWRKELTGKATFEVARKVMLLSLKLDADFQEARLLVTWPEESAGRSRQEGESQSVSRVLDERYARWRRLKPLTEHLRELQEASWEAEVVLGEDSSKEVSKAVAIFKDSYGDLASAIESYFETSYHEAAERDVNIDEDWLKELRKIIYSAGGDDFSKKIDNAREQVASALQAYVK